MNLALENAVVAVTRTWQKLDKVYVEFSKSTSRESQDYRMLHDLMPFEFTAANFPQYFQRLKAVIENPKADESTSLLTPINNLRIRKARRAKENAFTLAKEYVQQMESAADALLADDFLSRLVTMHYSVARSNRAVGADEQNKYDEFNHRFSTLREAYNSLEKRFNVFDDRNVAQLLHNERVLLPEVVTPLSFLREVGLYVSRPFREGNYVDHILAKTRQRVSKSIDCIFNRVLPKDALITSSTKTPHHNDDTKVHYRLQNQTEEELKTLPEQYFEPLYLTNQIKRLIKETTSVLQYDGINYENGIREHLLQSLADKIQPYLRNFAQATAGFTKNVDFLPFFDIHGDSETQNSALNSRLVDLYEQEFKNVFESDFENLLSSLYDSVASTVQRFRNYGLDTAARVSTNMYVNALLLNSDEPAFFVDEIKNSGIYDTSAWQSIKDHSLTVHQDGQDNLQSKILEAYVSGFDVQQLIQKVSFVSESSKASAFNHELARKCVQNDLAFEQISKLVKIYEHSERSKDPRSLATSFRRELIEQMISQKGMDVVLHLLHKDDNKYHRLLLGDEITLDDLSKESQSNILCEAAWLKDITGFVPVVRKYSVSYADIGVELLVFDKYKSLQALYDDERFTQNVIGAISAGDTEKLKIFNHIMSVSSVQPQNSSVAEGAWKEYAKRIAKTLHSKSVEDQFLLYNQLRNISETELSEKSSLYYFSRSLQQEILSKIDLSEALQSFDVTTKSADLLRTVWDNCNSRRKEIKEQINRRFATAVDTGDWKTMGQLLPYQQTYNQDVVTPLRAILEKFENTSFESIIGLSQESKAAYVRAVAYLHTSEKEYLNWYGDTQQLLKNAALLVIENPAIQSPKVTSILTANLRPGELLPYSAVTAAIDQSLQSPAQLKECVEVAQQFVGKEEVDTELRSKLAFFFRYFSEKPQYAVQHFTLFDRALEDISGVRENFTTAAQQMLSETGAFNPSLVRFIDLDTLYNSCKQNVTSCMPAIIRRLGGNGGSKQQAVTCLNLFSASHDDLTLFTQYFDTCIGTAREMNTYAQLKKELDVVQTLYDSGTLRLLDQELETKIGNTVEKTVYQRLTRSNNISRLTLGALNEEIQEYRKLFENKRFAQTVENAVTRAIEHYIDGVGYHETAESAAHKLELFYDTNCHKQVYSALQNTLNWSASEQKARAILEQSNVLCSLNYQK